MALFNFRRDTAPAAGAPAEVEAFLTGFSMEVMPRTAEKVEDFRAILPRGTRVYIAHIDGTPIEDMVATAKRIGAEGFDVMPHFPARIIKDRATLLDWVARYREVGVEQGLLLAGGVAQHVDVRSIECDRRKCVVVAQAVEPAELVGEQGQACSFGTFGRGDEVNLGRHEWGLRSDRQCIHRFGDDLR